MLLVWLAFLIPEELRLVVGRFLPFFPFLSSSLLVFHVDGSTASQAKLAILSSWAQFGGIGSTESAGSVGQEITYVTLVVTMKLFSLWHMERSVELVRKGGLNASTTSSTSVSGRIVHALVNTETVISSSSLLRS